MSNEIHMEASPITDLKGIQKVYFIGIGGIGMSALARYFHLREVDVSGYDKNRTNLTRELEEEGIPVHYREDIKSVPKDTDLVVYTPAVPQQHAELAFFRANGYRVVKRSDVLQAITSATFNICVAGTHGKTTISTMIAHILRHCGYGCNAFLGGIAVNYNTNFWSSERELCVVEADEYDRSFLKLSPNVAVVTAMDPDHLDIYGDEKSMQDAFVAFGARVKKNGLLVAKFGLNRLRELKQARMQTYSLQNDAADVFAQNVQIRDGGYHFDVHIHGRLLAGLVLRIGGMHNVENAVAAIAVAWELQIDEDKIRDAVAAFRGVHRRFEYVLAPKKTEKGAYREPVLIDDYAHHPEELRSLLSSVRSLFPQRLLTVIFQPHLYTRTRDFAPAFSEVLSMADRVILLPIYPARELPIEGVNSEMLLQNIVRNDKALVTKEGLLNWIRAHMQAMDREFGEVIVMAGAGDIDALVQPVKQIMEGGPPQESNQN